MSMTIMMIIMEDGNRVIANEDVKMMKKMIYIKIGEEESIVDAEAPAPGIVEAIAVAQIRVIDNMSPPKKIPTNRMKVTQ